MAVFAFICREEGVRVIESELEIFTSKFGGPFAIDGGEVIQGLQTFRTLGGAFDPEVDAGVKDLPPAPDGFGFTDGQPAAPAGLFKDGHKWCFIVVPDTPDRKIATGKRIFRAKGKVRWVVTTQSSTTRPQCKKSADIELGYSDTQGGSRGRWARIQYRD